MATKNPQAAIFDRDPKNKWDGGEADPLIGKTTANSEQFKRALYQEQRVLKKKIEKLTKMLSEKQLGTAERYALKKSLEESNASMKTVAEAAEKELEFMKSTQRYQQEALRKLTKLREFNANQKTNGPMSLKQKEAMEKQQKLLQMVEKQLQELTGKDVATTTGRMGTFKALSRLDRMVTDLPVDLQKMFSAQEQFTEEAIALQRRIFDDQQKERQKQIDKQKKDEDKRKEDDRRRAEKEIEEAAATFEKRLSKGFGAYKELQANKKRRNEMIRNKSLSVLDRLGVGKLSLGTVARGAIGANNLRKSWRDGGTGFQQYMQNRALASGRDPSTLRFGLGNVEREDNEEQRYRERMTARWGGPGAGVAQALPVPDMPKGNRSTEDQLEVEEGIAQTLKDHTAENARFNARMLDAVKKVARASSEGAGGAANSSSFTQGAAGGAAGGALARLAALLPAMVTSVLPPLLALLTPALLLKLGVDQKRKIEENPNSPEFDDNAYARNLRGKADSVGQGAAMQAQKALKTLQPGVAKQYLAAGPQADGSYLDGYSKQQLEDMAAGRKPDTASMEKFVTIQTGAQKAASAASAAADDNGDTQRMASRSQVNIPAAGSSGAQAVGAMGAPIGSGGKLPGDSPVGSGGMIKDSNVFTKNANVNVDGVNPQLQSKLVAMGQEYKEKTGKTININSGYRSIADQEKLYKTMKPGMAAKPGSSLHNYGLAVDIPSNTANELDKLGLLQKYGMERPISNEPWHIQPKGVSVAAAKSGIYSADAPKDQGASTQVANSTPSSPSVSAANVEAPKTSSGAQTPTAQSGGGNNGTSGNSMSVSSIPTFDSSDGTFFALNLGVV
jgi:hypothetical protein